MFAPPGTPQAIVRRMSEAMNKVARDPGCVKRPCVL
jgi:tripartite-type tricarboxylate transporter receptor subunit TctC